MLERELTLYKFNFNYLRLVVADLGEEEFAVSPFPGANPPVWILGHLAVSTDYAGKILGLEMACPRAWHPQFGPRSNPAELKTPLPSKGDLLTAYENGHRRVSEAAVQVSSELLHQPHAVEILKSTNLATLGDVLAHLMCTHESFHIAQLSACRRKTGKGPII